MSVEKKISNLQRQIATVRSQTKPEKKRISTALTGDVTSDSPSDILLTPAQGTSEAERIGNVIKYTGVYGRFYLSSDASGGNQHIRVIVYTPRDRSDDLATAGQTYQAPVDEDKYNVWKEYYFSLNATAGPGAMPFTVRHNWGKFGMKCTFDGVNATDVQENPVRIFFASNHPAAGNPPGLNGYIRAYYTDV